MRTELPVWPSQHDTYDPQRPIMTAAELAEHQVDAYGRDYNESDDGYEDMEVESRRGWGAISGWGKDGWDMGSWPYVVISRRRHAGAPAQDLAPCWEVLSTCEGDRTVYRFQSEADQLAALDYLFVWYGIAHDYDSWTIEGLTHDKREALDAGTLRVPAKFRGPYGASR